MFSLKSCCCRHGRTCGLLTAFAFLVILQQALAWQADRQERDRAAQFQATLESHARESWEREQVLRDNGRLWTGALHAPVSADRPAELAPGSTTSQKHIAGQVDLGIEPGQWSARMELHECDPGSSLCSSGGTILLFNQGRVICTITTKLLQSQSGPSADGFRAEWAGDWAGGRLQLLRMLGGNGAAPTREEFQQLLRAAYGGVEPREALCASLIRGVFRAISAVRLADESMDAG
jgi:hypothetical protein